MKRLIFFSEKCLCFIKEKKNSGYSTTFPQFNVQTFGTCLTKRERKSLKMLAGNVLTYYKTNNWSSRPPMLSVAARTCEISRNSLEETMCIASENLAGAGTNSECWHLCFSFTIDMISLYTCSTVRSFPLINQHLIETKWSICKKKVSFILNFGSAIFCLCCFG